jgi:hypothetical protein
MGLLSVKIYVPFLVWQRNFNRVRAKALKYIDEIFNSFPIKVAKPSITKVMSVKKTAERTIIVSMAILVIGWKQISDMHNISDKYLAAQNVR